MWNTLLFTRAAPWLRFGTDVCSFSVRGQTHDCAAPSVCVYVICVKGQPLSLLLLRKRALGLPSQLCLPQILTGLERRPQLCLWETWPPPGDSICTGRHAKPELEHGPPCVCTNPAEVVGPVGCSLLPFQGNLAAPVGRFVPVLCGLFKSGGGALTVGAMDGTSHHTGSTTEWPGQSLYVTSAHQHLIRYLVQCVLTGSEIEWLGRYLPQTRVHSK